MEGVGVSTLISTLRHYLLPDATDRVYQEVTKILECKRTTQLIERFPLEFDILRTKAEKQILQGFQFPDSLISNLCMQHAMLS